MSRVLSALSSDLHSPSVVPFVSWKCILIIALDACFMLKLKDRSFIDPNLGTRLAYIVNDDKYQQHLSQSSKDPPLERYVSQHLRLHIHH